ncbi:hypothetical protein Tcan_08129 [Toxocara canis]|uniref:Uncharacterized protein n=1 Tax=Toxocara canis TaxID=6265 RepID=A0A0B2VV93_TOXCA|nr:hypothetical protein Tcan_08129 [Toxocara canis]
MSAVLVQRCAAYVVVASEHARVDEICTNLSGGSLVQRSATGGARLAFELSRGPLQLRAASSRALVLRPALNSRLRTGTDSGNPTV